MCECHRAWREAPTLAINLNSEPWVHHGFQMIPLEADPKLVKAKHFRHCERSEAIQNDGWIASSAVVARIRAGFAS
jgi:hypothetical protein